VRARRFTAENADNAETAFTQQSRLRALRVLCGCFLLCGLCLLCVLHEAAAQTSPPRPKGGNPEAAKIINPVASTPASIAAGKRTYTKLCVRCHGPEGLGDGTGATGPVPPGDLTDDQWDYGSSDGEIFAVIHDGVSADMESYAQRMSDRDIWNVINYLRTFSKHR
jgi:mono/diheme cytochrome c family protein